MTTVAGAPAAAPRTSQVRTAAATPQPIMEMQLGTWLLFDNVARHAGETEVVTRQVDGSVHRYTYADFARRTQQLMHALDGLGIPDGAVVATLAWNTYRHLECYFAVPCTGRVLHTLNLRLSAQELGYIIGHAGDRVILADADLLPLLEQVDTAVMRGVERIIVLGDSVPETSLDNVMAYETLIEGQPAEYLRREIPEETTCGICYTSGTTGRPKGVAYTHRSTYLHAIAAGAATALDIGPRDCVLPIVPMFHVNAWGLPYTATAAGAKQVLYAGTVEAASVVDLMEQEGVTVSAGVPTIWLMIADEIAARETPPRRLRHVVSGGGQPPRALIERYLAMGIPLVQAWGMTETSPLASLAWPKHYMRDWEDDRVTTTARCQAGLPLPGVHVSIRDDDNNELPWDGRSMGELCCRGPWIIASYLYGEGPERFTSDGWFKTGDIAVGSPEGYFVIADRSKDLIKSGGEWISSVDMEGAIMALPEVAEAAVVAIPDPKWLERPLACVVLRDGATLTVERLRAHLAGRGFARWQLPDRMEVIDAVPRTSVGKFDKKVLRARFST